VTASPSPSNKDTHVTSSRTQALRLLSMTPLAALALCAGCASTPPLPAILPALKCAPAIPGSYREPVRSVPLATLDGTAGGLALALDGQTARLDRANGRTADIIAMVDACDKRAAEVVEALKPKKRWWRRG